MNYSQRQCNALLLCNLETEPSCPVQSGITDTHESLGGCF